MNTETKIFMMVPFITLMFIAIVIIGIALYEYSSLFMISLTIIVSAALFFRALAG